MSADRASERKSLASSSIRPTSLQRPPLSDEVYELLKKFIVGGELSPGARYSEEQLASLLGVSRTPVREALRKLHQDGFVSIQPGRGVRVTTLSPDDLRKIYPIISVLEALAAELAVAHVTSADLQEMRDYQVQMKTAAAANDAYTFLSVNMRFHRVYIMRSENPELRRMIETLKGRIQRFRLISLSQAGRMRTSYRQHQQIMKAFSRRNVRLVWTLVRQHVLDGMQSALVMFEREQKRQRQQLDKLASHIEPLPFSEEKLERSVRHGAEQ
jgi:DNA-binding GntR family transcriptional regulator